MYNRKKVIIKKCLKCFEVWELKKGAHVIEYGILSPIGLGVQAYFKQINTNIISLVGFKKSLLHL